MSVRTLFLLLGLLCPLATSHIPLNPATWSVISNGGGAVKFSYQNMTLSPASSGSAMVCADSLASSTTCNITVWATVHQQLQLSPASCDALWVIFGYKIPSTTFNYFVLKTDGVEVGTASGSTVETAITTSPTRAYTATTPSLTVGTETVYNMVQIGSKFAVRIGTGPTAPRFSGKGAVSNAGKMCLYAKRSIVSITKVGFDTTVSSSGIIRCSLKIVIVMLLFVVFAMV